MQAMNAAVFTGPGRIVLGRKPIPNAGPGEAVVRITMTTICGTDVHILKGEYPVADGLTVGHEPVGVIAELGPGVTGYTIGQRVVAGAISPCGQCFSCLDGHQAQCGGHAIGGWRHGNTIDGCQAKYVRVPFAMANLAPVPDEWSDEQVLMCPDILSTGFGGAESGHIKIGDTVAVFAQGPLGLCAAAGARLRGATRIIAVDRVPERLAMAQRLGADHLVDYTERDPVEEILRLTEGLGADVAIEALGTQQTFESCLRCVRPGGTLSKSRRLFRQAGTAGGRVRGGAGRAPHRDHAVPGWQGAHAAADERGRVEPPRPATPDHPPFPPQQIEEAYALFANQRDGVLKVAIAP